MNALRRSSDGAGYTPPRPHQPMPIFDRALAGIDCGDPAPLRDDVPAGRIDTSRDAFAALVASGERRTLQARVLDLIADAGDSGMTLDELCLRRDRQTQSVSPRINELARSGLIKRSGARRPTRTGSPAYAWVVTANKTWVDGEAVAS